VLDAANVPQPEMTPERWRDVKAVLHSALERAPNEREAFLAEACANDAALRREVNSLLAAADADPGFLDQPHPAVANWSRESAGDDDASLLRRLSESLGDRYVFERELGGGGMSRVFLADDRALPRRVVVKVLRPDLAWGLSAERFAREVHFAARLQQANIVPVISAGETDGLPYYTMPYVRGESLRERLASGAPAQPSEALGILKDIARALAHAHDDGVVHRDIKPENILISGGTAVVTDFGIAKAISAARSTPEPRTTTDSRITSVGLAVGTPAYMAPEQAAGEPEADPRTDVYAFGVVAYELLVGAHPFAGKRSRAELMAAHVLETPRLLAERRPELPRRLSLLVMRCLAKNPADRFSGGAELLAALEIVESSAVGALTSDVSDVVVNATSAAWEGELPSIAVLPLRNLSADPENEYFSDGIAEEVLSALTRMQGLRVAARTSAFAFKGQNLDLRAIAERLGVKNVLEGSVRRSGSRVRIAVQLVSAADGLSFWSERYDRELADIFAVQEEIAQAIAVALERTLSGGRGAVIASTRRRRRSAVNADAFELYLRGRHLVEQRAEGMVEALQCFEQAIQLDPGFSPPHAGISYALMNFGIYYALRPREAFPRAQEAAERALAIDPTDALALVMRSHAMLWHEWDRNGAEALARRALDLAPGLYLAHDCLGWTLAAQGRFDEAIAAMQRARTLDPLSENATHDLAWILILAGRWEQGIREMQPALARHPKASELHRTFGFCLFYAGRAREARTEFEQVLQLNEGNRWGSSNVVQALAALGETDEARRLVRQLEDRAAHEPIPPIGIAISHHWLGDDDAAIKWLERSLEARDYWLVMLRFDPSMSRMRGNRRFQSIVERVRAGATV
jgi:serine/threonine protein kinase/tetratricopeptide (TPR) repeat protein